MENEKKQKITRARKNIQHQRCQENTLDHQCGECNCNQLEYDITILCNEKNDDIDDIIYYQDWLNTGKK